MPERGALVVEGIAHSYAAPVLDAVSFTVPPATLTAVVGPSGCGKSTLLRVLAGLERPQRGSARMDGVEVAGRPGHVAYHPQRDALLPWLRVLDNATLGARTCGRDRGEARAEALGLLSRFGLTGVESSWPDELSGGMRQRVALMRTWLTPLPAVVLDEPFGALDALTRRQMQGWLLGITASDQRPTLLVTHDIDEALLLADQVLVFSARPARIVHVEDRPAPDERRREHEAGAQHGAVLRILGLLGG